MKWFIGIVIALVVIIGGWYYFSSMQNAQASAPDAAAGMENTEYPAANANTATTNTPPAPPATPAAVPTTQTAPAAPAAGMTVNYTSSGFSPATVAIKKGESVTFIDQTGNGIWVASNQHPIHSQYSGTTRQQHCPDTTGTAFDQCGKGSSYTFVFQKIGTWGYHDHLSPSDTGTVVVQ